MAIIFFTQKWQPHQNSLILDTKMDLSNKKGPLFKLTLRSAIKWNCCLITDKWEFKFNSLKKKKKPRNCTSEVNWFFYYFVSNRQIYYTSPNKSS